jgi:predicted dehydrogenase
MPVPDGFDYDMWLGPAKWESYTRKRCHFWWRYILQYGGGEMTDRGAHIIDLGQFINNTDDSGPTEIWGKGQALKDPLFDSFIEYQFECTYPNGVRMIGGSEGKRGLKLVGTEGWIFIHIHGGRLEAHPKSLLKETIGPNEIHVGRSEGHHRDFLNAIKTRRKPIAHEEIGHRTASMCHLINIAMLTDKKLKWDPEKEQVTNNKEANRLATQRPMRSPWNLKPF